MDFYQGLPMDTYLTSNKLLLDECSNASSTMKGDMINKVPHVCAHTRDIVPGAWSIRKHLDVSVDKRLDCAPRLS
jgi:hypothetical protein